MRLTEVQSVDIVGHPFSKYHNRQCVSSVISCICPIQRDGKLANEDGFLKCSSMKPNGSTDLLGLERDGSHSSCPLIPPSDTKDMIPETICCVKPSNTILRILSPSQGGHVDRFNSVQPQSYVRLTGLFKESVPSRIGQTVTGRFNDLHIAGYFLPVKFFLEQKGRHASSGPTNNRK